MRFALVLAAVAAAVAAQSSDTIDTSFSDETQPAFTDEPTTDSGYETATPSPDDPRCRSGFRYYNGWCMFTSDPSSYTYQQAVSVCSSMGALAPSIHNKYELDFWSKSTETSVTGHFWLDAYCPSSGKPYVWRDGTPTDYMGPRGELQQCIMNSGYHIHPDGFEFYDYSTPAPAICVYPVDPSPEPSPVDVTEEYCACTPKQIYLDIVFVVDASADMTSRTVGDATATIQSTLLGLTLGTAMYQSNVAVVAFGDKVQTVRNFGTLRSENDIFSLNIPFLGGKSTKMTDAILQASSMISSNERDFTRGVIVLLSKSFNQLDATNIREASDAFQYDGGIFITIDYAKGQGIKGLKDISTTGYYINDATERQTLNADIIYAFCDANCFCPDGLYPYNVADDTTGREVPKGCYHVADVAAVYNAAEQNCLAQNGFVATVHDNNKNFFMISLFPPKSRYWLGLKQPNGRDFEWADGADVDFTYWAPGNPIAGDACVYGQQSTGFNSLWYSAPCTDPLKYSMSYACQLRPCDTDSMRLALALLALVAVASAQTNDYDFGGYSTDDYNGVSASPSPIDNYCACTPKQIYLDIVFIVDSSADMTSRTVGDATATIQSTLLGLTFGTQLYQSQVAVLAFGDKVQTVKNFGDLRNENDIFTMNIPYLGGKATKMTDAIQQASSMISTNEREFTRGVIVLLSKSFNQLDATNLKEASDAFQYDGGIFITIDYSKGGIRGLADIATTGYYINDASSKPDSLNADIIYAFCDANCFCADGLYPYNLADRTTGREVPMGCYHVADVAAVYNAAEQNCKGQKGFVATIHDNDKSFFMMSIFPPKARFWLGLKRVGSDFVWADGVSEGQEYWAPGNPVAAQDCVYGQQQQGFNASWFSAPCTDPLKNSMGYACQLRPCDTEYDCSIPE